MVGEKNEKRFQTTSNLWLMVAVTALLAAGTLVVPAQGTSATPPPETTVFLCTRRLAECCCLTSSDSASDRFEYLPTQNANSVEPSHDAVAPQPAGGRGGAAGGFCIAEGDSSSTDQQATTSNAYSGASTSRDRPRRRSNASPRARFLYVASILSPELVFEAGFPAPLGSLALPGYLSSGDDTVATIPTERAQIAFDNAQCLGILFPGHVLVREDGTFVAHPVRPVWVYEVRADQTFYDLGESMLWRAMQTLRPRQVQQESDGSYLIRTEIRTASLRLRHWVTSEILTENIRRAFPITSRTPPPSYDLSDPGAPHDSPFLRETAQDSLNYVVLNTRGSDQLLTWPNE